MIRNWIYIAGFFLIQAPLHGQEARMADQFSYYFPVSPFTRQANDLREQLFRHPQLQTDNTLYSQEWQRGRIFYFRSSLFNNSRIPSDTFFVVFGRYPVLNLDNPSVPDSSYRYTVYWDYDAEKENFEYSRKDFNRLIKEFRFYYTSIEYAHEGRSKKKRVSETCTMYSQDQFSPGLTLLWEKKPQAGYRISMILNLWTLN